MKKILLLSDTHSHLDAKILKYVALADEVWHAGDIGAIDVADQLKSLKPFRAVYGNIDDKEVRAEYPLDQEFTIEGVAVWMTHIGGYPNKYNQRIREKIQEEAATIRKICKFHYNSFFCIYYCLTCYCVCHVFLLLENEAEASF